MPCASVRSLEAFSLCLFDPRSLGSAGEAQFRLAFLRADAHFERGPLRGFGGRPEQTGRLRLRVMTAITAKLPTRSR